MSCQERISQLLTESFSPTELQVIDDSVRHLGHAGYGEAGESHYTIMISAESLAALPRIKAHRLIHEALKSELNGDNAIHALSIQLK